MTVILALQFWSSIGRHFEHSAGREMKIVFALERLEKAGLRAISSSNELVLVTSLGTEDEDNLTRIIHRPDVLAIGRGSSFGVSGVS